MVGRFLSLWQVRIKYMGFSYFFTFVIIPNFYFEEEMGFGEIEDE